MKTLAFLTVVLISLSAPLFADEGTTELPPLPSHISDIVTGDRVIVLQRCTPAGDGSGVITTVARTNSGIVYRTEVLAVEKGINCETFARPNEYTLVRLLWLLPEENEMKEWANEPLLRLLLQLEQKSEKEKTKFRL